MQAIVSYIFNAMAHGWGFIVVCIIFIWICYNADKSSHNGYSNKEIREVEEALKERSATPGPRSQGLPEPEPSVGPSRRNEPQQIRQTRHRKTRRYHRPRNSHCPTETP